MCCLMLRKMLIIFKCTQSGSSEPGIMINNVKVPKVDKVIHLGQ